MFGNREISKRLLCLKHELAPVTELNGSRQRLILSRKAWNANVTYLVK